MYLKLLPLLLLGTAIWWSMTAAGRLQRQLRRDSRSLNDWTILEKVRAFAKALGVPGFDVRVLDIEQVNGLALPDGTLFVSRGLYQQYLMGAISADAVAGVIAHEIGHVALGHHRRRLGAWRIETAALAAVALLLGRLLFGWLGLLAALGLGALRNSLTQRDEFEADAFAAQLMMRSGLDPTEMIALLKSLEGHGGGLAPVARWLTSHPPIPERIERLAQVIDAGVPVEN